jgi:uncharacterized protein YecE (DUF72 family)
MELRVGCSGWFYWHWKGLFYPADRPTKEWFAHYKVRFNTVELNAPFYGWPKPATVRQWRRQAKRNFRYAIKVNQQITHELRFEGTRDLIRQFYEVTREVGPYLGCYLFQCPPSFRYDLAMLENMVEQLDLSVPNAIEFRHKSWWNEETFSLLRQAGVMFCSVSGPRLPDDLVVTAQELYLRFHGVDRWYRYNYSRIELRQWAEKIERSGVARAWIFFNNDFGGFAPKNARSLLRMLKSNSKESGSNAVPG